MIHQDDTRAVAALRPKLALILGQHDANPVSLDGEECLLLAHLTEPQQMLTTRDRC